MVVSTVLRSLSATVPTIRSNLNIFRRQSTWRFHVLILAALFVVLMLASCSSIIGSGEQIVCPNVAVLGDARSITQFKPGAGRDLIDVQFEGQIAEVAVACGYEGGAVRMVLNLEIQALRGPAADISATELVYFVAVIGVGDVVLAKSTFGSLFEFRPNQLKTDVVDQLSPTIPIKPGETTSDYRILIGFQLSADELKFNRSKLGH